VIREQHLTADPAAGDPNEHLRLLEAVRLNPNSADAHYRTEAGARCSSWDAAIGHVAGRAESSAATRKCTPPPSSRNCGSSPKAGGLGDLTAALGPSSQ
jgi:hypothetical protein